MSYKLHWVQLVGIIVLLLLSIFVPGQAHPNTDRSGQEATSYPGPGTGDETSTPYPYPGEGEPFTSTPTRPVSATQPPLTSITPNTTASATPLGVLTLEASPSTTLLTTPKRDIFATEDAEMQGALVTPPASETPQPTATLTPTITPSATPTVIQAFQFNRPWFIGGILAPFALLLIAFLIRRGMNSGEFGQK